MDNDTLREGFREGFVKPPAPANGEAVEARVVPRPEPQAEPEPRAEPEPQAQAAPEPQVPGELPAPVNLEPRKETWPIKVRLLHKPTRDAKNQPTSELS